MKNVLLSTAALLLIAAACPGQSTNNTDLVTVRIPYAVHVGNNVLNPGTYTIEHDPGASVIQLKNDHGSIIDLPARTIGTVLQEPSYETRLTLTKTQGNYYLDKLWLAGKAYGYDLSPASKPANVAVYTAGNPIVIEAWDPRIPGSSPATVASSGSADRFQSSTASAHLMREVRHVLVSLPYYSIFDNLAYRVDGDSVTLIGQVTRPVLKSDAENAVKHIEGVGQVNDEIQVLPLSPMDDQIRLAEYRAIYGYPALNRYAMGALPPIHIIVDNGHVTLVGVVANEMDKNLAGIQANGVPGVFSVTNDLQVEHR